MASTMYLATRMIRFMLQKAEQDWESFIGEDGFDLDKDALVCEAFEWVIEDETEEETRTLENELLNKMEPLFGSTFREIREIVQEHVDEQREWHQAQKSPEAMLRYHGMSTKDFI